MIRRAVQLLFALAAAMFAASYVLGVLLSSPSRNDIGAAPKDLDALSVSIPSHSGADLKGWFVRGGPQGGAVLLLHGVRANRLAMLQRARFLAAAGYAVLPIDFQAHGESVGHRVTFGYLESRDAHAAFDYLRKAAPGERIGVIGVSMGGAAAVLADPPLAADAFVLEQVYSTIDQALDNRLRLYLGSPGTLMAPAIAMVMSWSLGIDPRQLRPIERISALRAPLLMIAGEQDRHTTLEQSRALFDAANEPKQFWSASGVAHVDLYARIGTEYEQRVLAFLASSLRKADAQSSRVRLPPRS